MADNTGNHLMSGYENTFHSILGVPHQVTFYVDHDGETSQIHIQQCLNQQEAGNFALTTLLNAYMLIDDASRQRRLYWCELIPGRCVGGQWMPEPTAGGHVDAVFLDGESGQIVFHLDAGMQCWRPHPVVHCG